jgi:hypothetical protein
MVMQEKLPILFLLLVMAAACWVVVISKSFRKKIQRPGWKLYKLNQEQKEMYDGIYLAGALIGAIAFTVFLLVAFVLAISRSS